MEHARADWKTPTLAENSPEMTVKTENRKLEN